MFIHQNFQLIKLFHQQDLIQIFIQLFILLLKLGKEYQWIDFQKNFSFRLTNHKIVIQTFERSAALERVERLRSYLSGEERQRDLFQEHQNAFLHLAQ